MRFHRATAVALAMFLPAAALARAPAGRYTAAGATVYDTKTKLTWQQTAPSTTFSLADAVTYCGSAGVSSALGGSGWRVPTVRELLTLVDFSVVGSNTTPTIDTTAFPATPAAPFWTISTKPTSRMNIPWVVSFLSGATSTASSAGPFNVRCVR